MDLTWVAIVGKSALQAVPIDGRSRSEHPLHVGYNGIAWAAVGVQMASLCLRWWGLRFVRLWGEH